MAETPDGQSEALADHFPDLDVQRDAARLGMWVFLATELLLFAALFAVYAGSRLAYAESFGLAAEHNTQWLGFTNTLVLVTSSLIVALGVWAVEHGRRRFAIGALFTTIGLGLTFLVIKGLEYRDHFHHGIFPGPAYDFDKAPGEGGQLFYTLYYVTTGLHAIHVAIGIIVLGFAAIGVVRGKLGPRRFVPVELGGMYWHLVDVIWLFVWPLFYLVH